MRLPEQLSHRAAVAQITPDGSDLPSHRWARLMADVADAFGFEVAVAEARDLLAEMRRAGAPTDARELALNILIEAHAATI